MLPYYFFLEQSLNLRQEREAPMKGITAKQLFGICELNASRTHTQGFGVFFFLFFFKSVGINCSCKGRIKAVESERLWFVSFALIVRI